MVNIKKDTVIVEEIQITSDKISNLVGEEVSLYRPPFGEVDDKTILISKNYYKNKLIIWAT